MDSDDVGDGDGVCNDSASSNASKRHELSGAANRKRKDEEMRKSAAQGCQRLGPTQFFSEDNRIYKSCKYDHLKLTQ